MQTSEPDVKQACERPPVAGPRGGTVAQPMHNVRLQTLQHQVAGAFRFELRRMALDRLLNLSWEDAADESRMA
jgi:hypothetical protein